MKCEWEVLVIFSIVPFRNALELLRCEIPENTFSMPPCSQEYVHIVTIELLIIGLYVVGHILLSVKVIILYRFQRFEYNLHLILNDSLVQHYCTLIVSQPSEAHIQIDQLQTFITIQSHCKKNAHQPTRYSSTLPLSQRCFKCV